MARRQSAAERDAAIKEALRLAHAQPVRGETWARITISLSGLPEGDAPEDVKARERAKHLLWKVAPSGQSDNPRHYVFVEEAGTVSRSFLSILRGGLAAIPDKPGNAEGDAFISAPAEETWARLTGDDLMMQIKNSPLEGAQFNASWRLLLPEEMTPAWSPPAPREEAPARRKKSAAARA